MLDKLEPGFRERVEVLIEQCRARGFTMRPFYTIRTPIEQARLWRQSRAIEEIRHTIAQLRASGADYLAQVLEDAGPQHGRWATNAIPGYSWHHYGFAVDCCIIDHGKAIWNETDNRYKQYADIARQLGLTAGYYFKDSDGVHVQMPRKEVKEVYSLAEVNTEMKRRFGNETV